MTWFYTLETRKTPPSTKLLELINTFRKLAGYKAKAQKPVASFIPVTNILKKNQENHPIHSNLFPLCVWASTHVYM